MLPGVQMKKLINYGWVEYSMVSGETLKTDTYYLKDDNGDIQPYEIELSIRDHIYFRLLQKIEAGLRRG